MTLKEKLEIIKGYDEQDPYATFMTIAEEFAIEFAEWIVKNCNHSKLKFLDYKELLETFKEEKGL